MNDRYEYSSKFARHIKAGDSKAAIEEIRPWLTSKNLLENSDAISDFLKREIFYLDLDNSEENKKMVDFIKALLSDAEISTKAALFPVILETISREPKLRLELMGLFFTHFPQKIEELIDVVIAQDIPLDMVISAIDLIPMDKTKNLSALTKAYIHLFDYSHLQELVLKYRVNLETLRLDKSEITVAKNLISLDTAQKQRFFKNKMYPYTKCFAKITYSTSLLACAQIASRKKTYSFNPTVLEGTDEFEKYLAILKKAKLPIRERFVVEGLHWLSGDIQIDETGNAKILIIDSAGHLSKNLNTNILVKFAEQFPKGSLFLSKNIRQYATYGCSVFALDDVRHLFTVEQYLPPPFKNLFEYLEKQKKVTHEYQGILDASKVTATLVDLPLSLMMTTQSTEIKQSITERPESEQKTPINKKGQTAGAAVETHFKTIPDNKILKTRNMRLEHTLFKMAKNICNYVVSHTPAEIEDESKAFTLESFTKRKMG